METRSIRTILYSIVTALILSAILLLLVPRLPFKGDARWTYQNEAARVDVKFDGHLKNARVGAEGADLKVSQPAWLSNESYQGTMVEIPVSYRTKSYQLKLSPRADEWGRDAVLVVELKSKDFQHRGMRRSAWVCFRNITLNGQCVAGEKVVWHNKPFVLKYPLPSSPEIILTFDVCKPFTSSDISLKNLFTVFLACLMLSLFFASPSKTKCHIPQFIYRKDIVEVLSDAYRNIDPVYRRSFWIIFGVLCFAFGFHIICYLWGNHDWSLLYKTHRWNERAFEGRYMIPSVKVLLSKGIYLPLIYDLITYITLAINAVLLCRYWRLEKRIIYYVLCGLVLTVQPFTLSMMYFVHTTPEVFIGVTCALVALLLSEKIPLAKISLTKKIFYSFIAAALVSCALAMYPVLINTIAVVFIGRLLVQSLDWDESREKLKSGMRMFIISAINIVLGIASYKLVITYVFPIRLGYNTRSLSLTQVPERLGVLLKQCTHQLYEYNLPFLPQWTLWVFLGFTIILALYICSTDGFKQKTVRLSLLFGSLFATQTAMIISERHLITGRVELFGLVFFEVLVMAIVITKLRQYLHNLWMIIGSAVVFASILGDLDCLRVWKLGFDAEKMLWNRVLARLENTKGFEIGKKYDVMLIGYHISLRPRYFVQSGKQADTLTDWGLLTFAFDPPHAPFDAHQFYYPTSFLSKKQYSSMHHARSPEYKSRMKRLYQAGVLQKAEVWPKPNGLIVWKDIILFVADGKELERCKKQFERELGKK